MLSEELYEEKQNDDSEGVDIQILKYGLMKNVLPLLMVLFGTVFVPSVCSDYRPGREV